MNNRFIISNDTKGYIREIPDKECCLVCGIIVCYNFVFIGIMFGLIQGETLNLNSTIF